MWGLGTTTIQQLSPQQHSRLERLCDELTQTQIPLWLLKERFESTCNGRFHDIANIGGKAGELHTLLAIEETAEKYGWIRIYMLEGKKRLGPYTYRPGKVIPTNIVLRKDGRFEPVNEIDLLIFMENLPVIIETHLSQYKGGSSKRTVATMVRPEEVRYKKDAIRRLVRSEPAIVYVIPRDQRGRLGTQESRLYQYWHAGNHLAFFPYEREEWTSIAKELFLTERPSLVRKVTDAPENGHQPQSSV